MEAKCWTSFWSFSGFADEVGQHLGTRSRHSRPSGQRVTEKVGMQISLRGSVHWSVRMILAKVLTVISWIDEEFLHQEYSPKSALAHPPLVNRTANLDHDDHVKWIQMVPFFANSDVLSYVCSFVSGKVNPSDTAQQAPLFTHSKRRVGASGPTLWDWENTVRRWAQNLHHFGSWIVGLSWT